MPLGSLDGFVVGITADRRWEEQATMLERRGARVVRGPSIRTLPLADGPPLLEATLDLVAAPPDVVVLTTGVGARGWFAAAASAGLDERLRTALSGAAVVARGPKAAGAGITAGLDVAWRAPSERSAEVADHLRAQGIAGRRVAVQRDGADTPRLAEVLRAAGADVVDVPVYRWGVPEDAGPASRLVDAIVSRQVDAVTFTSSPAVTNLLDIAGDRVGAVLDALGRDVVCVCVGPVCRESAEAAGIRPAVAPDPGRLGAMIRALEAALAPRSSRLRVAGCDVVVQGSVVDVDGDRRSLTDRERTVLDALLAARGAVVPKATLGDDHAVEVAIARLRARLGPAGRGVRTVPRRGYRLDAQAVAESRSSAVSGIVTAGRRTTPPPR